MSSVDVENIRNKEDGKNDGDGGDEVALSSLCPTCQLSTIMETF